jgi:hypothetical protein
MLEHRVRHSRDSLAHGESITVETIRQATGAIIYPWMGRRPTGLVVYLPNSYMAVQLTRDPPAMKQNEEPNPPDISARGSQAEVRQAYCISHPAE